MIDAVDRGFYEGPNTFLIQTNWTPSIRMRALSIASQLRTPITIWLGVTAILTIVNAFGVSTTFGPAAASSFWGGLVAVNIACWFAWRRLTPGDELTGRQLVVGAVLFNGLLAIEVPLLYRLMGRTNAVIGWRPFVYGLLVTAFVAYLVRVAKARRTILQPQSSPIPVDAVQPLHPVTSGILARAGIRDVEDLLAVRAEDHYCRLVLRNMESVLIHYRFKDAVMDLGDRHGVQVHRSAWVANSGVVGAQRDGRRWSLKLADGTIVPVSETSVALCRARGWLRIH